MRVHSAEFIKGAIGTDDIFEDGTPQIVFVGRSNVGKSSVINSLVNRKKLAITSSSPGRTQQINIFLVNKELYLVDVPGYGFAKVPKEVWVKIQKMIKWYLFDSGYVFKKIVFIMDAEVGPTGDDVEMFNNLAARHHNIVVVANKIDKIKKSEHDAQIQKIKNIFSGHKVIFYSAKKKIGVGELVNEFFE